MNYGAFKVMMTRRAFKVMITRRAFKVMITRKMLLKTTMAGKAGV